MNLQYECQATVAFALFLLRQFSGRRLGQGEIEDRSGGNLSF